ncbi:MAG: hypothetical protein V1911_04345 [Candidatus Micrarchaeota archaeon]
MKLKRHLRSIIFGLLFGGVFAILTNAQNIGAVVSFAFIGVLIPNLDINFITQFKKEYWYVNLFMIPFLIMLIVPGNLFRGAFFAGYYGHVVNDLDKKNNLAFARQRAVVGLMWFVALLAIMVIFNYDIWHTLRLFGI